MSLKVGKFKKCLVCNKKFWAFLSKQKEGKAKFCSRRCFNFNEKGKHHSIKTEFKKLTDNPGKYKILYRPNHPFACKGGLISEHRLAMENYLGRYLKSEEVVHHKNGIRNDNRIDNLELFVNKSEHIKLHKK